MDSLSRSILKTVAYYDVLNYSLTSFEIWKYLMRDEKNEKKQKVSLAEVIKKLEEKKIKKQVEEFWGFYFLHGRKKLVRSRLRKEKISQRKIKIIQKVVHWLRFVPYLRMIAITGKVAMKNSHPKSDLDLLIVLEQKRMFIGRTLITGLTHILGKRRYANKIADRICLNYFITEDSLLVVTPDIFSSSEYFFAFPVFGWKVFQEFQKQNSWIKNYKINYQPAKVATLKMVKDNFWSRHFRKIGEKLFNGKMGEAMEQRLQKWQLARIKADLRTKKKGSGVMASDKLLAFWPNPQGPKIYEKFKNKIKELGLE